MKVNDILYCKIDYWFENKKLHAKNVGYKIVDIFQRIDIKYTQYLVNCDNKSGLPCIFYKTEIDQYFYTLEEYRKLKLKKLNESNL